MNKTTEALKLAEEALLDVHDHRPNDMCNKALAAILEALADHSGDSNEMVMDWSKVKPEAINSDPMYQMGYAAAMSKFAAQFQAEPVKQEPVAYVYEKDVAGIGMRKDVAFTKHVEVGTDLYAAPVRTKDLTDEELNEVIETWATAYMNLNPDTAPDPDIYVARAIIATYKEKNK